MPELPPPPPPPLSLAAALVDLVERRRPAWLTRRLAIMSIGAAGSIALLVVALSSRYPAAPPEVLLPRATGTTVAADSAAPVDGGSIAVHAAGAFNRPGLYELPPGSRVAHLIDAAGGTQADAVVDAVNLAARLNDGERVYLPRQGEAPVDASGAAGPGTASDVVDLNTATLEQLDALPGVGPSTAQAILDHRREHGRFRSVEQLLEVRGIGEAKLAAIRKRVRV